MSEVCAHWPSQKSLLLDRVDLPSCWHPTVSNLLHFTHYILLSRKPWANPKASMPPPSSPASRGSISAVSDRLSEASVAATVKSDEFPTGAKQEIRALARDECWACRTTLLQACHVMAKADTQVRIIPSFDISNLRLSGEEMVRCRASNLEINQLE